MIDTWLLPGPAWLASRVVDTLANGHQCVPVGSFPSGFRRAVETALLSHRTHLAGIIYDDPGAPPGEVVRRQASTSLDEGVAPTGIWWIEDVATERIAAWLDQIECLGEEMRHLRIADRLQLIFPLPSGSRPLDTLGVSSLVGNALGRADLEVAARYLTSGERTPGLLTRLRVEAAVEMTLPLLPDQSALDALSHWIDAPAITFGDPVAFARHARESGLELRLPDFELWRLQHAVLLAEVERHRIQIVQANPRLWEVPCEVPATDSRPPKWVSDAEKLELRDLCRQLRQARGSNTPVLAKRLQMLRDLRNALSHLEPAAIADFQLLSDETRSEY